MNTEDLKKQLEEWEGIIFNNWKTFQERVEYSRFRSAYDLTDIYFCSSHVKIYYNMECGQPVADSASFKDVMDFIDYIKNKENT